MTELRPGLPELPRHLRHLPINEQGYPVPHFVGEMDGQRDFRVVTAQKIAECVRFKRCWTCGEGLGAHLAFVVGPMCGINRTSSEPPSHLDCARYSVQACPFLSNPAKRRRTGGLPDDRRPVGGFMIERNPGVSMIWSTKSYRTVRAAGVLFRMGEPTGLEFWREGRHATREEVSESVRTGLPDLEKAAALDGAAGKAGLERAVGIFWQEVARFGALQEAHVGNSGSSGDGEVSRV